MKNKKIISKLEAKVYKKDEEEFYIVFRNELSDFCESEDQFLSIVNSLLTENDPFDDVIETAFLISSLENTLILKKVLEKIALERKDILELLSFSVGDDISVNKFYRDGILQRDFEFRNTLRDDLVQFIDKDVVLDRMSQGHEVTALDIQILNKR